MCFDPMNNHYMKILQCAEVDTTVRRVLDEWKEAPEITFEQILEALMVLLVRDKQALINAITEMAMKKGMNEVDSND